jgi:excisionase family DNA binding protein
MLTPEQAAAALGIGRTSVYALIKSGELRSLLIGRLRRIPLDEIHTYTAHLIAQQHPTTEQERGPRAGDAATRPNPPPTVKGRTRHPYPTTGGNRHAQQEAP